MKTQIQRRVEKARAKRNAAVICEVPSGWVVMGDVQYTRGYCLLLPDPVVPDLNYLDKEARDRFLTDMVIVGDALLEVTDTYRINYEILGDMNPALHAHIIPRYMSEPEELRKLPVWFYERERVVLPRFDAERDKDLMRQIRTSIQNRL